MAEQDQTALCRFLRPALGAVAISLSGCAVGPDFQAPAAPSAPGYVAGAGPSASTATAGVSGGQSQRFVPGEAVQADWWRAFGSPELDAMVQEALKASPDLVSAEAALRQAQALYAAQRGAELPSLDGGYQAQQAKNSATIAPPLANNSNEYALHTVQLTVAYTLDVFGALRRQSEAAGAQADAARYQFEAARVTLIANVVTAAVEEASLAEQVVAARQQAADNRTQLAMMERQAQQGEIGQAGVAAQQARLAQANQAVPPLLKSLAQQRSALAILLGREPGQGAPEPLHLDRLTLPADLPVSLPAELVRQRPDILAAEANLHAASAQVGVAIAARLPDITLGGMGGAAASQLGQLLSSNNSFWTLSAGVAQPIFEGGALKQKQKAAEAALDQAKAQYRSTVLTALKSVADSLDALTSDADALKEAAAADAASARSLSFARRGQRFGELETLDVLNADQTYAQSHAALIVASAARFEDTAALFQALGGGI